MRKKHKNLSLFLVIIMMINIFIPYSNIKAANDNGEDVTNKVTLEKARLWVIKDGEEKPLIDEDGNKIEPQPEVKNGDPIKVRFEWSISQENLAGTKAGDYFTVDLPDPRFADIKVDEPQDLVCSDGVVIGTYIIVNGQIITTFNEEVEKKLELKNGYFEVNGNLSGEGELHFKTEAGEIIITVDPYDKPPIPDPGEPDGTKEIDEEKLEFTKDGKQYSGKNELNWHVNINYDQLANMIAEKGITQKYKMTFEDKLVEGLEIDENNIKITAPLFVPTPEKTMSDTAITYREVDMGEIIRPNSGESYDEFYKRIKETDTPVIGIFENNIVIGFGDLPGNNVTYDSLMHEGESLEKIIDQAPDVISQEQKEHMKRVYSKEGNTKGQVLAYDISFDTIVTDKATDKVYTNEATIRWNEKDEDSSKWEIKYDSSDAGVDAVDPGELRIKKLDDKENTIPGVVFKLQKQNEEGNYVDYSPLDNGGLERTTNEEGIVEFKKLVSGFYKIVEVKSPLGYGKPIYEPNEFFEIKEGAKVGVYMEVVNPIIKPTQISIGGNKELTGRQLKDQEFSFQLLDKDKNLLQTVKNKGDEFLFADVEIPSAGTYEYTVKEEIGSGVGITYDASIFKVKVVASLNEKTNALETKITYTDMNGNKVESIKFTNTYTEPKPAKIAIGGSKKLTGRQLKDGEFSFQLLDKDKNLLQTVKNKGDKFLFADVEIPSAGTYEYTVKEEIGSGVGITYDASIFKVKVVASLNEKTNELETDITYTDMNGNKVESIKFTNTYTEPKPAKIAIGGSKKLTGRQLKDQEFSFQLLDKDDKPLQTVKNKDGKFTFADVEIPSAGTYEYTVKEVKGSSAGITYDASIFEVKVVASLNENTNALETKITYTDINGNKVESIKFTNTYTKPKPTRISIGGNKKLTGRQLKDQEFSFQLLDKDNKLLQTVKNKGDEFLFADVEIPSAGTYEYTVKEVKGSSAGITYDASIFKVKVVASLNENTNALETKITYTDMNGNKVESIKFTNTYTKPKPAEVEIEVEKVLEGRKIKPYEFFFNIKGSSKNTNYLNEYIYNGKDEIAKFGKLIFKEEGIYNYKITELNTGDRKINYDDTVYELVINVELKDNNELVAKVELDGNETTSPVKVVFTNIYRTRTIEGEKR